LISCPRIQPIVAKTKERLIARFRDTLRYETGLKLNRGISEAEDPSAVSVPTKLGPEVTAGLHGFAIPGGQETSVLLEPLRQHVQQLKDSPKRPLDTLFRLFVVDTRIEQLAGAHEAYLRPVSSLAEALLKRWTNLTCQRRFWPCRGRCVRDLSFPQERTVQRPRMSDRVVLGIIGLLAMQKGVEIEALRVVLIAHKLAHAYTRQVKPLVEGLAQHYTMLVSKRITTQAPYALAAYRALLELLERQPEPYKIQTLWEKSFRVEQVRLAFVRVRRMRTPPSIEQFTEASGESKFNFAAEIRTLLWPFRGDHR
jgi:hypothetical protein